MDGEADVVGQFSLNNFRERLMRRLLVNSITLVMLNSLIDLLRLGSSFLAPPL